MKKLLKKILPLIVSFVFLFSFSSCFEVSEKNQDKGIGITHKVTFYENGGSSVSSLDVNIIYHAPTTAKSGHLFLGWYLDKTLSVPAVFPLSVEKDTYLYAKWLKLTDSKKCAGSSIKFWTDSDSAVYYRITPSGFDLETLDQMGYWMEITVDYAVLYVKDYDILWDIGYAGSPKYEAMILNSEDRGTIEEDLTTKKSAQKRSISYITSAADLINEKLTLKFSTDNIQNIIYFDNITVTYNCYKR